MGTTLPVLCQGHRRGATWRERKRRCGIGDEIEYLQRGFQKTTENERYDIWNIRDGVELPLAGRTIIVGADGALFVFVMVYFADEQRHAQVEQAKDNGCEAVLHCTGGNLNSYQTNVKGETTEALPAPGLRSRSASNGI